MKKTGKIANALAIILMAIVGIAIGGLFVNGTFLSVVILKYLPEIIHTIVGWLIIIMTILSLIMKAFKL